MIYADNAATTRISDNVIDRMLPFLREQYGNASSQYSLGARARHAVELALNQAAAAIGAEPLEITFTSGGSEANSWVLRCVSDAYREEPIHIITSAVEHHSVLNACHALERRGVEITYLRVDTTGRVSAADVEAAVKPYTRLVSIMLANNETGTIEPIAEIGQLLRAKKILFHTDAVQAVGHIPVDVNDLQVDFLTASAHKFNGAKGTGILYKRSGSELSPLVFGGEQEHGLRSGTENVAGIVAAGCAIEENIGEMAEVAKRLNKMVGNTIMGIREKIPSVRINGSNEYRLPGTANLGFDGISANSLMHLLDLKGICVSTGSACTSGRDEPSHVLLAMGLTKQQAKSAIRISYGKYNRIDDVDAVVEATYSAYAKMKASR